LRLELERAEQLADTDAAGDALPAGGGSPAMRDALHSVQAQAERLDATITDLISLARDLPPRARSLDLTALLTATERRWRAALAARSRPLRIDREAYLPTHVAMSDAAAAQVLDVLIDNASMHGRGAITIRVHRTGGMIAIDVSDEGPSLEREAHELFTRRNDTGHGIGLPYARKLADAEGARLTVAATAPPTFRLLVPDRAG
jgi:signal transduction histidine kinase